MGSARVGEKDARLRVRPRWGLMVTASILMVGTVALVWLAAVPFGAGVCPTIDPPPTSCSASYRAGSGMVATIILLALYVVTMLAAVLRRSAARPIAVAGVVILVLAPVVTYAAVAWSSGFILSEAGELGADIQTIVASPTDDPVGQWGEVGERSAFLTVLDDGTVAGSDGCNGMSGAWSVSDGRVVFSDMITSLMMCSGLESELQGSVVAAVASGDTLYVLDENGGLSGVLSRAPNQ